MMKSVALAVAALDLGLAWAASTPRTGTGPEVVRHEDMVVMSDGVRLYTRAIAPKAEGKWPCVFMRTPYPRADELKVPYSLERAAKNDFVKRGYVSVVQHCRGFGRSEGLCRVYDEREDGLVTLDWIRRQSWYNGEIFLVGASYTTTVHLFYLSAEPPDVKGACLEIQTDRMFFRNYRNGCNWDFCNFNWWRYMMGREFPDAKSGAEVVRRPYRDIARRAFGRDVPRYTEQLMHETYDSFWTDDPRTDAIGHIRFPVLWKEGLYDFYIEGMTSMWERMTPEAKSKSAFVLGPGGHGGNGLVGTPLDKGTGGPGLSAVDFFDAIRRGAPETAVPVGKMVVHSIGSGGWQTNDWPRATSCRTFSFNTSGRRWTYDPNGPRIPGLAEGKSQLAWSVGSRTDATEFVSAPFAAKTAFFGRPRIRVPVRSDCEDTQFFFRLDLVTPEGAAYNLCQTISSLRHAKRAYRPGETVVLDLEFPLTAFTVNPGWAVRIDACSDGGVYVQHANVAKHWAEVLDSEVKVAHNEIVPGEVRLDLPLL